jgi:imidazolonepropionase-like amidohydrolase
VVDVVTGALQPARTVVIRAGRIVSVGPRRTSPPNAVRINGTGKFLIPGLWDMHAHHQISGVASLELYLANGVVGTRDMGSDLAFILPLRRQIQEGALRGPIIVAAGPILDAAPAGWPYRQRVENADQARTAVRDLKSAGVDFIKVHDATPRDAFFAIAAESRRLGLTFAGHVPAAISIEEASAAGIRSIEHLANSRVPKECSGGETYESEKCRSSFQRLAARGVWQTPTLAFYQAIPHLASGGSLPHGEFAGEGLGEFMRSNFQSVRLSPPAVARLRALNHMNLAAVRDLQATGNRLLAGCDGLVPGFCIHDELEWLTKAGLTPAEALRTATINPARFLGRDGTTGTIAVGKRADLVLLDANPLTDIRNTRRIRAVVANGALLARQDIDAILAAHKR